MYVPGDKIAQLIDHYGKSKGYPAKSYLKNFTKDFELNYNQWNSYCNQNGGDNAGIKVLGVLLKIFPDLNLNWLFKDDYNMFQTEEQRLASEPDAYSLHNYETLLKEITNLKNRLVHINKLSQVEA
jgi:hypothetical protein